MKPYMKHLCAELKFMPYAATPMPKALPRTLGSSFDDYNITSYHIPYVAYDRWQNIESGSLFPTYQGRSTPHTTHSSPLCGFNPFSEAHIPSPLLSDLNFINQTAFLIGYLHKTEYSENLFHLSPSEFMDPVWIIVRRPHPFLQPMRYFLTLGGKIYIRKSPPR